MNTLQILTTAAVLAALTSAPRAQAQGSAPVVAQNTAIVREAFGNLARVASDEEKKANYVNNDGKPGFGFDDGYAIYGILLTPGGKCLLPPRTFRRADAFKIALATNNAAAPVKLELKAADGTNITVDSKGLTAGTGFVGGVTEDQPATKVWTPTLTNTGKTACYVALAYLRAQPPVRVPASFIGSAIANLSKSVEAVPGLKAIANNPSVYGIVLGPGKNWNLSPVGFFANTHLFINSDAGTNTVGLALTSPGAPTVNGNSLAVTKLTAAVANGKLAIGSTSPKPTLLVWTSLLP